MDKFNYNEYNYKTDDYKNISICRLIGCSGVDKNCPGNPNCNILNGEKGKILRQLEIEKD